MLSAIAILTGVVFGTVTFTQESRRDPVIVTVSLKGLTPGEHGFHVHQFGVIGNSCLAAGPHLNPFGQQHGSFKDSYLNRHVGDLGNVKANSSGIVDVKLTVSTLSMFQVEFSPVGRAIVIHEKRDDLGKGGDAESLKTGNAGKRLNCAIVGLTS